MIFQENNDTYNAASLEGNIAAKDEDVNLHTFSTIDEPIADTIKKDLYSVGKKFKYVLFPKSENGLLREWDLWGPLILCMSLSVLLQSPESDEKAGGPEFAQIFVIFWFGAFVVTFNSQLLGGTLSFLQIMCALGYCVLPLVISLIACRLMLIANQTIILILLRMLVVFVGLLYSSFAATIFLSPCQKKGRTALAVYPICLFYVFLAWLVISA